jgi:hypothetical protein
LQSAQSAQIQPRKLKNAVIMKVDSNCLIRYRPTGCPLRPVASSILLGLRLAASLREEVVSTHSYQSIKSVIDLVGNFHSRANLSLVNSCRLRDFETSACIPVIDINCDTAKRFTEFMAIILFRLYASGYCSHHHEAIP